MESSSVFISAAAGDNNDGIGGSEDALVEYKSSPKIHNPFKLYDNFRKGCTNVLTAQRSSKGSNGFRNNGGHPNHHNQGCYEVADAQSSLSSSSIQITSIKPRRLNSEEDSSDSSNSAEDTTQVIKTKPPKHRSSNSSNFSSSSDDSSYPQQIGDFSKEIFSSLDSTLGRDDSLILGVLNDTKSKTTDSQEKCRENETQCKRRSTINDGNTTDDSGVDSICCILDSGDKCGSSQNNNEESREVFRDQKASNASPSLRGATQSSKSASSFLQEIATYSYDTISKKRNSIWKREYNISGTGLSSENQVYNSVEEECKDIDTKDHHTYANVNFRGNSYSLVPEDRTCNVELTSVVQNKSLVNIPHNVSLVNSGSRNGKQNQEKSENIFADKHPTKVAPIYSSVNVSTKKSSKKKGKDSSVCRQISNAAFSKLPVLKFLAEDIDIGENSNTVEIGNTSFSKSKSSSPTLGPQEGEVTDLRGLTKLLNNTSALLQRNSNLRASLTISVKNPRNGVSNAKTFVLPSVRDGKASNKNDTFVSPDRQTHVNDDLTANKEIDASQRNNCNDVGEKENEPCVPFGEFQYKEVAIDCDFKNSSSGNKPPGDSVYAKPNKISDDKEAHEEDQFVSLVNIDGEIDLSRPPAFVRHNPNRRPVVAAAMTTTNTTPPSSSQQKSSASVPTVCRRSIRLAPKTVANLANKFEACGLLEDSSAAINSNGKNTASKISNLKNSLEVDQNCPNSFSKIPDKELKLCKKDITKIIGTLNRLEEDAKRSCYRPRPMTAPADSYPKKNIKSTKNSDNENLCEKSIIDKGT